MRADTPALVVGAGLNGLGVARSLARAGVPAWLADSDPTRAEMRTRMARPVKLASLHGDALIDELVRLGITQFAGVRPVLLLTQEESVKLVSHQRERLADLYRFSLPPKDVVDALLHKYGFQCMAERFGAPIPALVHVSETAELRTLEDLTYPVVVKPGERNAAYGRQFKKAYRLNSAAEAIELVSRILPVMPDVVVQEWTEGPDSNIYFCLQYIADNGVTAASFTGRKVRSWPPQVGGTASCVSAPDAHAELSALTTNFFKSAGVIGMAAMEYKRDSRGGGFRMVEPTIGRTDYQAEIATLNGVNLPCAAYRAQLGKPYPAPSPVAAPVGWRVRSEDVQSATAQNQPLEAGFDGAGRVFDALLRWNDPQPFFAQTWQRARHAVRARIRKAAPTGKPIESKP